MGVIRRLAEDRGYRDGHVEGSLAFTTARPAFPPRRIATAEAEPCRPRIGRRTSLCASAAYLRSRTHKFSSISVAH
jgi:hypothetical protein